MLLEGAGAQGKNPERRESSQARKYLSWRLRLSAQAKMWGVSERAKRPLLLALLRDAIPFAAGKSFACI